MTAATASGPTLALVDTWQKIYAPDGFLAKYNVERDDEIEILGLSTVAGVDVLFLGDPGVGKTWAIELQLRCILGASLFDVLLSKDMSADEVLGPRSLIALKDDRIERLIAGFLPTANYGYLDEVFKASPTLLNPLLDLTAKRELKVAGNVIDCGQLITLYMSSNELPDREDLMAFRDRIGITKYVQPVRSPEGQKRVMSIQLGYQAGANQIDMSSAPTLTLDQINDIRREVSVIDFPESTVEAMQQAQDKWADAGHPPSQRRIGQMLRMMKARAWSQGRDHVTNDDMIVCQHMAWNHPDHAASAHDIVIEFANVFTRKAARVKEALEPILTQLDEMRGKIDSDDSEERDKAYETGWTVMRDLRRLRREAKDEIQSGQQGGHDTRELEKVMSEINKAHDYAEKALSEDENGSGA